MRHFNMLVRVLCPQWLALLSSLLRYNSVFKIVYIGTSSLIVWYMRRHRTVKNTYDKDHDTFR